MSGPLVAIHQPNFFPWLGWFDKATRADVFVVLDDVQFPRGGGTWLNRTRLLVGGDPAWVTAPVLRAGCVRSVNETFFAEGPWRRRVLRTFVQSYADASSMSEATELVSHLMLNPETRLVTYNLALLRGLLHAIGSTSDLVLQSSLGIQGRGTELLVALVQAVGGTAYLAGGGATGYQDDRCFEDAGIEVVAQRFVPPRYSQGRTDFEGGLSVLDALAHCGIAGTAALLSHSSPAPGG